MKKIIQWYNILVGAGMTEFKLPEETSEETTGETPAGESEEAAEKPE